MGYKFAYVPNDNARKEEKDLVFETLKTEIDRRKKCNTNGEHEWAGRK